MLERSNVRVSHGGGLAGDFPGHARRMKITLLLAGSLSSVPAMAADPQEPPPLNSLEQAITQGQFHSDFRLRYGHAEQGNVPEDGNAVTGRLRLGYQTGALHGFDAYAEYEGVYALGGTNDYNSGPAFLDATNGNSNHALIADPTGNELNKAWVRYQGAPNTIVKVGRQRVILDNARFIGDVGFRDNEQTFDAARVDFSLAPDTTLTYSYVWRENFIFFNDNKMRTHLINLNWQGSKWLHLSAYTYLIDFSNESRPRNPGAPDSRTEGIRADGEIGGLGYALEYAHQDQYADAPSYVDAGYYMGSLKYTWALKSDLSVTPSIAWEVLGGNGGYGFQTPLATNHKFQGFADVFLSTPVNGVRDANGGLAAKYRKLTAKAIYHDFNADKGSQDYGKEVDGLLGYTVNKRLKLLAVFADYDADQFATNTRRYTVQAEYSF